MKFVKLFIITLGITLLASGSGKTVTKPINTEKACVMVADDDELQNPQDIYRPRPKSIRKNPVI